jgi:hypothetical protein
VKFDRINAEALALCHCILARPLRLQLRCSPDEKRCRGKKTETEIETEFGLGQSLIGTAFLCVEIA